MKLSAGIYPDAHSIQAVVNCAAGRKTKRFPHGTDPREIQRWRNLARVELEATQRRENDQRPARTAQLGHLKVYAEAKRRELGRALTLEDLRPDLEEVQSWPRKTKVERAARARARARRLPVPFNAGGPTRTLGGILRSYRLRQSWTIEQLCGRMTNEGGLPRFDRSTAIRHEQDQVVPAPRTLEAYAKVYTVATGRAMTGNDLLKATAR
jgi:hypothetical protein